MTTVPRAGRCATAAAGVAAWCLVALTVLVAPAVAGAPSGAAAPPRITLAAQPAWVPAGGGIAIDVRIENPTPGLAVAATVHRAVRSRSEFQLTVDGRGLGAVLGTVSAPLDQLPDAGNGARRLVVNQPPVPAGQPPATQPPGVQPPAAQPPGVALTNPGVYPVSVELRNGTSAEVVDRFVTYVVVLGPDPFPARLSVAWVWPLAVREPRHPDGSVDPSVAKALEDGNLARIVDALPAAPDVPVTLAPEPATLDAWRELAAADPGSPGQSVAARRLDTLRGAISSSRQVLAGPYVGIDLTTMEAAGLDKEIGAQLARGSDVLRDALGVRPDPRTFVAGPLDERALTALRDAGVDRLLVDPSALVPVFQNLTPARPFDIVSRGRTFRGAGNDTGLAALLSGRDIPDALLAQRFLAGLAVVALEAPVTERGVVVMPPEDWQPSAPLLATVLRGLADHPALRAVTLDTFFSRVPAEQSSGAQRVLQEVAARRPPVDPSEVHSARQRLDSMAEMLPGDDPRPAAGERLLLLSEAARWEAPGARRRATDFLNGVDRTIRAVLGTIRLPGEHAVTLTAREARIPVAFLNASNTTVRVKVRLVSDQLSFPGGAEHVLSLPPRTTTSRFAVQARTSGAFPLVVSVTSPDGRLSIGRFRLTIRSTAVSGVALALTVGAAVFLAAWWANHIWRARRARRRATAEDGR